MNNLVAALAPAFAAGFAVQQLLEILDPILSMPFKNPLHKKVALSIISLLIGLSLAMAGLRVLKPLQASMDTTTLGNAGDFIVTALMISGGTEGFNSVMKFLGYKKDEQKAQTARSLDTTGANALAAVNRP